MYSQGGIGTAIAQERITVFYFSSDLVDISLKTADKP